MKRIGILVSLAVGASLAPWTPPSPAMAATATPILSCRASNPDCWPTGFAFSPKGHIFYVERFTGQIRRFNPKNGSDRLWATIGNVATAGEQGLLSLALDPRWRRGKRFQWVYAFYTRSAPFENRIIRLRKLGGRRELLASMPAAGVHNGGVIGFGPGGKLIAVTGDAADPANSQDLGTLAGKVLRMTKRGRTPKDNPVIGGRRSRVLSFGHRNSFGFAFDPFTKLLWQTENGPGGSCDDEINRIAGGANYGWGSSGTTCGNSNASGPSPTPPALLIEEAIAPTGAAFCKDCGLPGMGGRLLYAAFREPPPGSSNDGRIWSAALDGTRTDIVEGTEASLYDHALGILAMKRRKGLIYFSDQLGIYRLSA